MSLSPDPSHVDNL